MCGQTYFNIGPTRTGILMFLKVHRGPDASEVIAICDRELLNATLRQGDHEIVLSEKFYGNCLTSENDVREALRTASNANLIGPRAVSLAIEMGLISSESCIEIAGIPHALIFEL
jgi:hypothetical protein